MADPKDVPPERPGVLNAAARLIYESRAQRLRRDAEEGYRTRPAQQASDGSPYARYPSSATRRGDIDLPKNTARTVNGIHTAVSKEIK